MRIAIAAVGRLKAGPERELFERYFARIEKAGGQLGLNFNCREIAESRAGDADTRKAQEAAALVAGLPKSASVVLLDEGGQSSTSRAFSARIVGWRDQGCQDLVFVIGGPDGLDLPAFGKSSERLALGAMTWPHQIVRILLAEQLYRAVMILSGHPYHRD